MSLEAEDHPLKGDDIIRIIDPISTEMDVETAAAQLRTQIAAVLPGLADTSDTV